MAATEDLHELLNSLEITASHIGGSSTQSQASSNDRWRRSLYGKIHVLDKAVRFKSLQNMLLSIWARYEVISISSLENSIFMAEFSSNKCMNQVLADGPWNYMSDFIILEPVIPDLPLNCYKFDKLSIWVQLHYLPINLMTAGIVTNLVKGLGTLHHIDPLAEQNWKNFARVCLTVSTNFQIMATASTKLESGLIITAALKYERLHRCCII